MNKLLTLFRLVFDLQRQQSRFKRKTYDQIKFYEEMQEKFHYYGQTKQGFIN